MRVIHDNTTIVMCYAQGTNSKNKRISKQFQRKLENKFLYLAFISRSRYTELNNVELFLSLLRLSKCTVTASGNISNEKVAVLKNFPTIATDKWEKM